SVRTGGAVGQVGVVIAQALGDDLDGLLERGCSLRREGGEHVRAALRPGGESDVERLAPVPLSLLLSQLRPHPVEDPPDGLADLALLKLTNADRLRLAAKGAE